MENYHGDMVICKKCHAEWAPTWELGDGPLPYNGVCRNCGTEGPPAATKEEAIKKWNEMNLSQGE